MRGFGLKLGRSARIEVSVVQGTTMLPSSGDALLRMPLSDSCSAKRTIPISSERAAGSTPLPVTDSASSWKTGWRVS